MLKAVNITVEFALEKHRISGLKEYLLRSISGRKREEEHILALDRVDFEAQNGQCVGLIGHNGCGKSTLLKTLAGVLKPQSGAVEVTGRLTSLIELGAGFDAELSGSENIDLNCTLMGLKKQELKNVKEKIIEFSELGSFIDQPLKNYSSGMQARLGFSCATAADPDIMLIDEVLAVGDENFQRKCLKRIEELRSAGKIIVIVSHDLNAIERHCTKAVLLHKGRIVAEGESSKVVQSFKKLLYLAERSEKALVGGLVTLSRSTKHSTEKLGSENKNGGTAPLAEPHTLSEDGEEQKFKKSFEQCVNSISIIANSMGVLNILRFYEPWEVFFAVNISECGVQCEEILQIAINTKLKIVDARSSMVLSTFSSPLKLSFDANGELYGKFKFSNCLYLPGNYVIDCTFSTFIKGKEFQICKDHLGVFKVEPNEASDLERDCIFPLAVFFEN